MPFSEYLPEERLTFQTFFVMWNKMTYIKSNIRSSNSTYSIDMSVTEINTCCFEEKNVLPDVSPKNIMTKETKF